MSDPRIMHKNSDPRTTPWNHCLYMLLLCNWLTITYDVYLIKISRNVMRSIFIFEIIRYKCDASTVRKGCQNPNTMPKRRPKPLDLLPVLFCWSLHRSPCCIWYELVSALPDQCNRKYSDHTYFGRDTMTECCDAHRRSTVLYGVYFTNQFIIAISCGGSGQRITSTCTHLLCIFIMYLESMSVRPRC